MVTRFGPGTNVGRNLTALSGHSESMNTRLTSLGSASTRLRAAACFAAVLSVNFSFGQTTVRDDAREVRERDRAVRTETGERVKLKNPDKNFVEKVTRLSLEEAEVSRVAAERTSNPRVKAFAQAMAADHAAMSQELSAIAADKGVALPAKDSFGEKWVKKDGKSFDVDYMKKMLTDHEETVKLFQRQARDGNDPELVAFARKHLPAIQHHLQEASDLHKMMKD